MPPAKPKVFREHCFHEYQPNLKGRNSYKRHACPEVPKPANHVAATPVVAIPPTPPRAPQRPAVMPIEPVSGTHSRPPLQTQVPCMPGPQFPALHTPQSVLEYVHQMQQARENLHLQQRMLERQMTVLSGFLAPELVQQLNTAQHELAAQLAQAQVHAHASGASMPIPINNLAAQHPAVRRLSSGSVQPSSPSSTLTLTHTPSTPASEMGTPEMSLAVLDCGSPSAQWDASTFDATGATPVSMGFSPLGLALGAPGIADGAAVAGPNGLSLLDTFAMSGAGLFDPLTEADDSCAATDSEFANSPGAIDLLSAAHDGEDLVDSPFFFEFAAGVSYNLDATAEAQ